MEGFKPFLQSEEAPLVCAILIFVGISAAIITKLIFGKKIKVLEESLKPNMSPAEKQPIQQQIKTFTLIIRMQFLSAIVLTSMGVIGLTYKF